RPESVCRALVGDRFDVQGPVARPRVGHQRFDPPMPDLSGIAGDRPRRADPTSHAQVPGRDLYFGGYCVTCGGSVDLSAVAHHFSWSVAGPVMTASGPASPSGGT